eukprot:SAG31_NODE_516_length_14707_cov_3.026629_3_plen_253_part_00
MRATPDSNLGHQPPYDFQYFWCPKFESGTAHTIIVWHLYLCPSFDGAHHGHWHRAQDVPKLAVDGVIIIAEHGDFPWNERQARLHPRKAFLEQVCGVFAQSGRSVPVFNDKHLAPDWQESVWMVERCRELGAPFMAGSSIPLVWRKPWLEHPAGTDLLEAVCVGFSGLDIYGAHACDALQAMVERRGPTKSETGVCAVQCLQGDAVWQAASEGRFDMALAQEAVSAVESNLSEVRHHPHSLTALGLKACLWS